jgi:hypothetical protein
VHPAGSAAVRARGARLEVVDASVADTEVVTVRVVVVLAVPVAERLPAVPAVLDAAPDPQAATRTAVATAAIAPPQRDIDGPISRCRR